MRRPLAIPAQETNLQSL